MDLATLVGLVGGVAIILSAIMMGGSALLFFNIPGLLIVLGGTLAATLIKFPMKQFLKAFSVAMKVFRFQVEPPENLIKEAVELAAVARKGGLLALEQTPVKDPFFKKGIQMCADGHDASLVRKMLSQEMGYAVERHENGQKIFRAIGDSAPAMGMIGTLIGLVQMLATMDDPKSIGPAMAVALLTTLYGALIATLFALPVAEKLALRSEEEQLSRALVIESIGAIQEGMNPKVLEGLLMTFLPDKKDEKTKASGKKK